MVMIQEDLYAFVLKNTCQHLVIKALIILSTVSHIFILIEE